MKDYEKTPEQLKKDYKVTESGLYGKEAAKRLLKYGKNTLADTKKKGPLQVFLEQFKDLLVLILICAAAVSAVSGNPESTVVIAAVIILNAVLGTVQHFKAEKSLDSLKALSSPSAKVIRDGQKLLIPASELVPGDLLLLEAGDLAAADARIITCHSLKVNESSLTGESIAVDKTAEALTKGKTALGDQKNMVFSGSLITYGRGSAIVTSTGMNTEIGRIAELLSLTKEKKTPLQISLDRFGSRLAMGIMGICALVFILSMYRQMPVLDSLMFAVALAVAAIPEALSSIVTIVQAMGTQRMVKENAIMKELKAVESLGCVSVICSDKTGTLTQNKMTVQKIYTDGRLLLPEEMEKGQVRRFLTYACILDNDAVFRDGKGIGDPTEYAMVEMGEKLNICAEELRETYKRLAELPFDSDRKLMSTKHIVDGRPVIFTKGAVDVLLGRCKGLLTKEGAVPLDRDKTEEILKINQKLSEQGLRVLAAAYKESDTSLDMTFTDEADLTFLGLVSMADPPREESKTAVSAAKEAGIRTIMITGDHKVTASAIASELGILEKGQTAVTGPELDEMTEEELMDKLEQISVYARVSPENKIRIVGAWQKKGRIAAMTGDGVNDAPALKKADIGIAMGITGTEVSKDAAAMILSDDNFATIVKAVSNGRSVYRNIKNAIQFLLSGNTAGIISVLYTFLLALPVPFAPVHLLFMNLLTDSLPALAIGMERVDPELLKEKPRDPSESILSRKFLLKVLLQGGCIFLGTMLAYYVGLNREGAALASTMAFCTLTLARLFHGFNCRGGHSIFRLGIRTNRYSLMAFAAGFVLLSAVMFITPLQNLFAVVPMEAAEVFTVYGAALLPTVIIQGVKCIRDFNRKESKRRNLSWKLQI